MPAPHRPLSRLSLHSRLSLRKACGLGLCLLCLLSCLPVFAQTGNPTPGWYPLKPDGTRGTDLLNTDANFYLYDWTKLDWTATSVIGGKAGKIVSKYVPGTSSGYLGNVGSNDGSSSRTLTVNGSSTIKYQWVPPASGGPTPPLYALASITASASIGATSGTFTGSVQVTDGWNWLSAVNTCPGQVPTVAGDNPRRHIVAGSGTPATFALSPSAYAGMTVAPYGNGSGGVSLSESLFPILLSSPNPFGRPELGDGTNQYVYDNIIPSTAPNDKGHLFVEGTIQVPGAANADLTWLLAPTPKVDCTFDAPMIAASGSPAGYTWTLNGSNIQVQTSSLTDSRVVTTHNQFVFFGLPANNGGFGNHQETMTVQTADATGHTTNNPSQLANIQTFFLSKASNYPGAYTDYLNSVPVGGDPLQRFWIPNWYHYYNQVSEVNPSVRTSRQSQLLR